MIGLNSFQLIAAGVHFIPAVVWAIIAQHSWRFVHARHSTSRFFRMLPGVGGTIALSYGLLTVICLIPEELQQQRPAAALVVVLYVLNDWFNFATVALARHLSRYFPTPEQPPPSSRWLALNYGSSLGMDVLAVICISGLIPVPVQGQGLAVYRVLRLLYQLVMLGLVLWQLTRLTRPGLWGAGSAAWIPRRADAIFLGGGLLSLGSWMLILFTRGWASEPAVWPLSSWGVALDALAGVGFAVPLAVRILGEVIRGVLIVAVTLGAAASLYFGVRPLSALVNVEFRPLLDLGTVFAFVLLFAPGQTWLRAAIDHLVFRRSRRRHEQLQAFPHTLSPELGVAECCRRALPQVVRVMQLRSAAIRLPDGAVIAHGAISLDSLQPFWAGGAFEALPAHALVGYELRELPAPLVQVMADANIVGLVPITSPHRCWGAMFISTGLLGGAFSDEDERGLEAFGDQLALVLDGAELLARAVAVERSLAHAEKLAAIGELAARVAHEIRNPITAARSLAQQLCGDPQSPLNAEHAELIVTELDRVERQVSALLRFARREEFRFEPVDLGDLVRATVDAFRPRLAAAEIEVRVDGPVALMVPGDREKIRQMLLNLLENAIDALADAPGRKHLSLALASINGSATLQVADTGPGVTPEVLTRLFEPFFSGKPKGTGLGLAIAKRTVEAHGGTITATSGVGTGMTFCIDLPLKSNPGSGSRVSDSRDADQALEARDRRPRT